MLNIQLVFASSDFYVKTLYFISLLFYYVIYLLSFAIVKSEKEFEELS